MRVRSCSHLWWRIGAAMFTLLACVALAPRGGIAPVQADEPAPAEKPAAETKPFTGSIKLRQKDATLYYKIYLVRGKVIGGYDTWEGLSKHYHQIVGGWYDGRRLVLLVQSTEPEQGDKWFSHEHHFEREGDKMVIKHSLYGFGKTLATGEVYTPHVIDAMTELPAADVRRLAALPRPDDDSGGSSETSDVTPQQRLERLENENLRLRETIAELRRENAKLRSQPPRRE